MLAGRCGFEVERTLSAPSDPNLRMLLRRSETSCFRVDPANHDQTLAALSRYNLLTYHLRPAYLLSRACKIASYLGEHLFAKRFVRRVEAMCREAANESGTVGETGLESPRRSAA